MSVYVSDHDHIISNLSNFNFCCGCALGPATHDANTNYLACYNHPDCDDVVVEPGNIVILEEYPNFVMTRWCSAFVMTRWCSAGDLFRETVWKIIK